MPKRRIGLQKDVSSIFKGIPLSADERVATSRHMPILEPPKCAAAPQPTVAETSAMDAALTLTSSVESGQPSSVEPAPVVSEQRASAEPQPQRQKEPTPAVSLPKVSARKKPKIAVSIKAPRPAKGGIHQSLQRMKEKLFASKPGLSGTRQKAVVVLVPVLAIALVFVLTQVVSSPSRSLAKGKQKAPATTVTGSAGEIDWKIPVPYPATLRDPMQGGPFAPAKAEPQAPQISEPEAEKLIVRSILHSESKPSAVVGTEIVHEGDTISGAIIVRILKDGVEFEKDGKKWTQKIEN